MRIGIDIMGGDYAPDSTVTGAIFARKELPESIHLVLIGDKNLILPILEKHGSDPSGFEIVHTTEVIGMCDSPTKSFSQKPDSSITVGFNLLKEKKIDAFASAGNTGALLVGSMYTVKAVPGVIRPCITSVLPKEDGSFGIILDVGANSDCKPDVLYQFGILGSLYIEHVFGVKKPRISLLNIGEEEEKGNLVSQAAYAMMNGSKDFNFVGNVEGRDLFNGKSDVVVCDGFTGNVVLKEAEAFFYLIKKRGISDEYFDRFNYESYGGSPILGINSTVIVGHGISNAVAIKSMIKLAKEVTEANLPEKIKLVFQ